MERNPFFYIILYKRSEVRLCVFLLFILLSPGAPQASDAGELIIKLQYSIEEADESVGVIESKIIKSTHLGRVLTEIHDKTYIQAESILGDFNYQANQISVYDENGLLRLQRTVVENGEKAELSATRLKHELVVTVNKLEAIAESEPIRRRFGWPADQQHGVFRMPDVSYDITYQQLPDFVYPLISKPDKASLRVLDTETFAINGITLQWLRRQYVEVTGKSQDCHVFLVREDNSESYWYISFLENESILVMLQGLDDGISYQLKLQKLERQLVRK